MKYDCNSIENSAIEDSSKNTYKMGNEPLLMKEIIYVLINYRKILRAFSCIILKRKHIETYDVIRQK